jgi:phage tail sheath protein FI
MNKIERGPRPIEGVPTSTAALIGETERGSVTPREITSYKDYQRWFGDVFDPNKFVPYAVNGFFENGGKRAFVARVVGNAATPAAATFDPFIVRAAGPGSWGNRVKVKIGPGTTLEASGKPVGFKLQLAYWSPPPAEDFDPFAERATLPRPALMEEFDDLVADESSPDFYGKRFPFVDLEKGDINQGPESSALGILVRNAGVPPGARPSDGTKNLVNGGDEPVALGPDDFEGRVDPAVGRPIPQGLAALELDPYRDVALVYAPNASADIARRIVSHCERLRFRFAVIDSSKGDQPGGLNPRNGVTDTSHAALYYPWIFVSDPRTGARKMIPPCGYVLGVYARSDTERGVFKAPANEIVRGALSLEVEINDEIQDSLNPKGVNAVRSFPGRGIRVWGARTLTSNPLWKYVSVRRLFIFLERSIYEGTHWVVFEPNDDRLWARVTDTIRLFLRSQWRLGALFGRTEQEAFFITCDRTTMSQDDILNGRLICEIGIAPVRPAEFVIFRIFQNTAEAQR